MLDSASHPHYATRISGRRIAHCKLRAAQRAVAAADLVRGRTNLGDRKDRKVSRERSRRARRADVSGGRQVPREPYRQNLAADILCAVISFEAYDALAEAGHNREDVVATTNSLARCAEASSLA